jgi:hypothetical protein
LNVVFGEIFSEALLAFARTKCAGAYLEPRHGLLRGARDKTRIPAPSGLKRKEFSKAAATPNKQSKIAATTILFRRERLMLSL